MTRNSITIGRIVNARYRQTCPQVRTFTRAPTLMRLLTRYQRPLNTFMDYGLEKFPFRIHTIRTDRGYEFQAQFHRHVEEKGIRHGYIRPHPPELNGKGERSHRTDQEELFRLLSHKHDVDLGRKLKEWESFYNYHRPHGAFGGRTP